MKDNLLFIAPVFFGYYQDIINGLQQLGYEVDYICDAPSKTSLSKALGRIDKRFIRIPMWHYFNNVVLPKIKNREYQVVFVLAGMTFSFSSDMLEVIKQYQKKAYFVMYQWDSEKNLPFVTTIQRFFDKVYTFDRYDSNQSTQYTFLPLFYVEDYRKVGQCSKENCCYDCSYIGTAHPQKYKCINDMSRSLSEVMPNQFIYHYMPSRLKYFYHKLVSPEYRGVRFSDFQTQKATREFIINIFKKSKCILDSPQCGQSGLTIRTIEALGAKRKLITTNADIIHYDFYCENNILIYDDSFDVRSAFFSTDYKDLPEEIYSKYSLNNWLKSILEKEQQ